MVYSPHQYKFTISSFCMCRILEGSTKFFNCNILSQNSVMSSTNLKQDRKVLIQLFSAGKQHLCHCFYNLDLDYQLL